METTDVLDEYAQMLLDELQKNSRLSVAELGRRIGLSPSATAERMRRLEDLGVIRGYTIEIDREALGLPILAYIRMTCDGNRYKPFLTFVQTLSEVRECHHLTGGDAFILKATMASTDEMERLIEKLLPYGTPTTSIVLSSPVVRNHYDLLPKRHGRG